MSEAVNNTPMFYSNRTIVRGFIFVVLMVGLNAMLPLYMQNRLNRLYKKSHDMNRQIELLERQILLQEFEVNKLTSLEHLSDFAENASYGLYGVPTKVRLSGGVK